MAKKSKKKAVAKRTKRQPWTKALIADLRKYSKERLPLAKIAKLTKRTPGALRTKGFTLGIRLGHRR